jgi:hypothetical protein
MVDTTARFVPEFSPRVKELDLSAEISGES